MREEAANWVRATGHANVVPIFEAAVYGQYLTIASEYVSGGDLRNWLKRNGNRALSPTIAAQMMDGILAGLAHLHGRSITQECYVAAVRQLAEHYQVSPASRARARRAAPCLRRAVRDRCR